MWNVRNDYLHSPTHPWTQSNIRQLQRQLQKLGLDTTAYLTQDYGKVKQWTVTNPKDSMEEVMQKLDSVKAARLHKQSYTASLQPQRDLLRNWLSRK